MEIRSCLSSRRMPLRIELTTSAESDDKDMSVLKDDSWGGMHDPSPEVPVTGGTEA